MFQELFKNYNVNFNKLIDFGFNKKVDSYEYSTSILNNQFSLIVNINFKGEISFYILDTSFNEKFVLPLLEEAQGKFIGKVREEIQDVLLKIRDFCYYQEIFKTRQAKSIIGYIKTKYKDDFEYLWEKFPNNAICRRKDNKKWYILLLTVNAKKIGINKDEVLEIIDLRFDKEKIEKLVDNIKFFKGYHMNKNSWISLVLNNDLKDEEIFSLIDNSYLLAGQKK